MNTNDITGKWKPCAYAPRRCEKCGEIFYIQFDKRKKINLCQECKLKECLA